MITKYRTVRLQKDCNLNRMGKWNHTDRHCYSYKQTNSLCIVLDDQLQLVENYETFKCDGRRNAYFHQVKMLWTHMEGEPTL